MRTGKGRAVIGTMMGSLLVGVFSACGDSATPATTPSASAGNTITLSEMKVAMPTTFPAGKPTFTITNAGMIAHELLVFRSALTPDKYPTKPSGVIDEEGPGISKVSDGENVEKGQSQTRQVDLSQPGTYLFVCNLPGHFAAHMYAVVTVGS